LLLFTFILVFTLLLHPFKLGLFPGQPG